MGSVVNKVGSYVGVPHGPILGYPHNRFYGPTGYSHPQSSGGFSDYGGQGMAYSGPGGGHGEGLGNSYHGEGEGHGFEGAMDGHAGFESHSDFGGHGIGFEGQGFGGQSFGGQGFGGQGFGGAHGSFHEGGQESPVAREYTPAEPTEQMPEQMPQMQDAPMQESMPGIS